MILHIQENYLFIIQKNKKIVYSGRYPSKLDPVFKNMISFTGGVCLGVLTIVLVGLAL